MSGVFVSGPTSVFPSPRDLVAQLSDNERVAVDHILAHSLDEGAALRGTNVDPPHIDDPALVELVEDKPRRGRLLTVAAQLRALGVTLHDAITLADLRKPTP